MKILSPTNHVSEIEPLVDAGAEELYAGVLARDWKEKYTNVASINRREWSTSSLQTYEELEEAVEIAHRKGARLFVTLNALYTKPQYEMLTKHLDRMRSIPIDAVIVADLGLLLTLRQMKWPSEIHISTGGTTFNSHAAKFYHRLGASRVVLPRHFNAPEIVKMVGRIDYMEREVFIMNAGCKNVDGFCTFQHGINEILHGDRWKLPKKLGLDQVFYKTLRLLPPKAAATVTKCVGACGTDSPCLFPYAVEMSKGDANSQEGKYARRWVESTFTFYSGLDPCGACDMYGFYQAKVDSIKIVGRENPTWKKIKDVTFLKACLDALREGKMDREQYEKHAIDTYKTIIGRDCRHWCYYPRIKTDKRDGHECHHEVGVT